MSSAPFAAGVKTCCLDADSLVEVDRQKTDDGAEKITNKCRTCGCRHIEFIVPPIKYGIEGNHPKPLVHGSLTINVSGVGELVTIDVKNIQREKWVLLGVLQAAKEIVERMS